MDGWMDGLRRILSPPQFHKCRMPRKSDLRRSRQSGERKEKGKNPFPMKQCALCVGVQKESERERLDSIKFN